jgi:hypothetical protein
MQHISEQAARRISGDIYPELRQVLERFSIGVQDALRGNFIGTYLVGSLATGDFDLDSDIDFLAITNDELNDVEVSLLQALHRQIHNLGCYPAQHLEGSYLDRGLLNRADMVGVRPVWYVDNGRTVLERSVHDNQWHVRWVLRERGITLAGPKPEVLVHPVATEPLRAEILASMDRVSAHFLAEIGKPLGWFNTRFGQSFTVLTWCRMLHTLQCGTVNSKLAAVKWAEQSLDSEWHQLIQLAWAERKGTRFGEKVRQPADAQLLQETARFISCTQRKRIVRR